MIDISINKDEYMAELQKVLGFFHEAKIIDNKEQIKYYQGMSKGIILILKKLKLVSTPDYPFTPVGLHPFSSKSHRYSEDIVAQVNG